MSVYDFDVKDGEGNTVSLSQYKDKVLLIVNSATKCGFTPQYTELNEIYAEFNEKGFEILLYFKIISVYSSESYSARDNKSGRITIDSGTLYIL